MARAKQRIHHPGEESGSDELDIEDHEMERESETMSAAQRNFRAAQRNALAPFEAFDLFSGPMARVMDQHRMMLQKILRAMQEESLNFVNRRMEHTSHAIESCRDCHGVSGLMAVQQEWMMDFARDYTEQTKRITELMREFAEDGTATFTEISSSVTEHRREMSGRAHHAAA